MKGGEATACQLLNRVQLAKSGPRRTNARPIGRRRPDVLLFLTRPVRTALLAAVLVLTAARGSSADELVEWLFWNEIGNAAGVAAESYADYVQERQLWAAKIAEAKAELERCGGCASAQAELDKWQGIENQFQEFAGSVFQSVGMPPIVAQALGITCRWRRDARPRNGSRCVKS